MLEVNPRLLVTGTKITKENSGKISKGQRVNQGSEIGKKNVLFHLTFEEKKMKETPLYVEFKSVLPSSKHRQ